MGESRATDGAVRAALRAYLGQLRADRRYSIVAFLFPALGNLCIFYLPPLVIARLLGRAAGGEVLDHDEIRLSVALFVGLWLLGEACWRIGIHFLNRTDAVGIEALYDRGMASLLERDVQFFQNQFAGSLTKRVVGFASKYEPFVDTLVFNIVGNVLPLFVAGVILWRYDPRLVLIMLGLIVLTGLAVIPLIRRRQPLVDERESASATVAGHVADILTNMDAVRAHAAEDEELDVHRRNVGRHKRLALRSWDYHNLRVDGVAAPMSAITNGIGLLVALELRDTIDVEAVFVTFAYYLQATRILFDFNQVYRNLESSITEAAQLTELLLEEPRVTDPPRPVALGPRDASISFEQVVFSHAGAPLLFDGLDLRIDSGEKVGLVGRSGGGKTTLSRLLLRFMDVQGGRIMVGGQDITTLRQADLRSLIASVPQDPVMFHRTVRENIAFGRPKATEEEIRAAADAAHASEFIADLPLGLDTLVGERGVKLSGGQRQRIAIARAILRDAPILLLDEATSALDSETESYIQDALLHLLEGRTAVVIAHRLSTVQRLDRLVVIEGGRVVEQGSHDDLLAVDGAYARLWRRQSGGFLDDDTVLV